MLSACIIVKNEQDNLPRCLASLTDVASEIVVVDTGSSDNSQAVALSFGAKIYELPWTEDFSAARNFSLTKAQNPWAIVIDADEELDKESRHSLATLLPETPFDAFSVQIRNYLGNSTCPEVMVGTSIRLFRTNKGYTFRGRVHEDITPSIVELGGRIGQTGIVIHHFGYLTQNAQNEPRFDRNVRLLKAQLDANSNDGISWFYLGTEYFVAERHAEALECYARAIDLVDTKSSIRPRLLRNTVESFRRIGQLDKGYELVLKALREYPDYPDLWFLRGVIEEDLKDLSGALASLRKATALECPAIYETNITATREKANLRAAAILLKQGKYAESLEHVMHVLGANPRQVSAYPLAIHACLSLGHLELALDLLKSAVNIEPSLRDQLGSIADKIARLRSRLEQH